MISQVADLSLADKLSLIESITASIRKEGGMPAIKKAKAVKGEKDGAPKPKRKAALGTLAWTAYVKHCKTTMPDSFEGLTKESEKLVVVKGIRAEDPEGYTSFTEAWKAEHAEVASDASEAESVADTASVAEPVPEPVAVKKVVKAAPKAAPKVEKPAAAAAAAAAAAKPAAKPAAAPKAAAKAAAKAEKPAAAAAKPVKAVKKAAKVEEPPPMPQKEIDGTPYWHDPESNGLWEVTGETVVDGTGSWIGYYQPGNEEEPIRFTEAFGSD